MKINDIVKIKIEKIVFGGEGLGYVDNFPVFVPMSAIGDLLEIKIISIKKTYSRGLITKIIEPSPDRIDDKNISFEDYSGCDFSMLKYEKQIEYKKSILKDIFKNINEIDVVKSENKTNYRNKVAEPFVKINGEIKTGFFSKKSHNIFLAKEDKLRSIKTNELITKLLELLNAEKGTKREFKVYNDINKSGFLKTCIVRTNDKDELMLIIVVNKNSNIKRLEKLLNHLYLITPHLISVYISIKEKKDNVIFGEEIVHICGDKYLTENLMGINFKIYPDSFFQINKLQAINIYNDAISLLGDFNDKNVIDAFSGTGTLSMLMSKKAKEVLGIEMTNSSVKSAIKTSKENNIDNVEFICDKVENVIKTKLKLKKYSHILFDPPRKGIDKRVLEEVAKNKIENIVYISCNPITLYRDLKILNNFGYELKFLKGYDMFPQTHHIECVALISYK